MKNYVNWKAFDNSFNSLINKKDIFIQNDYISQNHIVTAKKNKKKKKRNYICLIMQQNLTLKGQNVLIQQSFQKTPNLVSLSEVVKK